MWVFIKLCLFVVCATAVHAAVVSSGLQYPVVLEVIPPSTNGIVVSSDVMSNIYDTVLAQSQDLLKWNKLALISRWQKEQTA